MMMNNILSNKQIICNCQYPLYGVGLNTRPLFIREEERRKQEELRLSKLIDSDTLMRFAYVPFVIAKLVWDYVDTILSEAARMKLSETKRLCRAIRELKRDYDQVRAPYIDRSHEKTEERNMYVYEDGVAKIMKQCLANIHFDLQSEYPELDSDYLAFIGAVYQCDITLKALLLYTERQAAKIAEKIDRNVGHILPDSLYKLNRLVLEFVGDKPTSERFVSYKKQYIQTFATQMALIELSEIDEGIKPIDNRNENN